jgi:phage terminase small subunit
MNNSSVVRFPGLVKEELERLARKREEQEKRDQVVIDKLYDILTADLSELIQHRRVNCRYCHGDNFEYQRKDWEMDRDLNNYIARGKNPEIFNKMGGGGFDDYGEPDPNCPNCMGHGVSKTYMLDTRKLSPKVRSAIASIKQTRQGTEVKFYDWLKAFYVYAQMRGLIVERKHIQIHDLSQMPEEQLNLLLQQSAPLIDNDDPELRPFLEMLEDHQDRPIKPRRALLHD